MNLSSQVVKVAHPKPVLLKLSPDLEKNQLEEALDAGTSASVQGFIFTNTTTYRPTNCNFPKEGGLSGRDLAQKSKNILQHAIQYLGEKRKNLLLISAGGVLDAEEVAERLKIGADLVQVYSALVFQGPRFFQNVAQKMQMNGGQL